MRILLATLLCHANQPVTVESLVDALWGLTPPRQTGVSLRVYVHHLRQLVGDSRIERRSEGYTLLVQPDEFDVERFHTLVAVGRDAVSRRDPAAASSALRTALGAVALAVRMIEARLNGEASSSAKPGPARAFGVRRVSVSA